MHIQFKKSQCDRHILLCAYFQMTESHYSEERYLYFTQNLLNTFYTQLLCTYKFVNTYYKAPINYG